MSERCEHEDEQLEILRGTHGLYVGLLSPEELKALNHLCEKGLARRSYEGVGGFIGLAKVDLKVSEDFRGLTGTPLNEDPTPSAGIFGARTR